MLSKKAFSKNKLQRFDIEGWDKESILEKQLPKYLNSTASYKMRDQLKQKALTMFKDKYKVEMPLDTPIDDMLSAVKKNESLTTSQKEEAQIVAGYLRDVLGVPSEASKLANSMINNSPVGKKIVETLGVKSDRPISEMVQKAQSLTSSALLGGYVPSRYFTQFATIPNAWAKLASEIGEGKSSGKIVESIKKLATDKTFRNEIKDKMDDYQSFDEIDNAPDTFDNITSEKVVNSAKNLASKAYKHNKFFFKTGDTHARMVAFSSKYLAEIEKGVSVKDAARKANEFVRHTNFDYGVEDSASAFRNPLGRFMLQFKPYATKQLEFLISKTPKLDDAGKIVKDGTGKTVMEDILPGKQKAELMAIMAGLYGTGGVLGYNVVEGAHDIASKAFGDDKTLSDRIEEIPEDTGLERFGKNSLKQGLLPATLQEAGLPAPSLARSMGLGDLLNLNLNPLKVPSVNLPLNMIKNTYDYTVAKNHNDDKGATKSLRDLANNIPALRNFANTSDIANLGYTMKYGEPSSKGNAIDALTNLTGFRSLNQANADDVKQWEKNKKGLLSVRRNSMFNTMYPQYKDGNVEVANEYAKQAVQNELFGTKAELQTENDVYLATKKAERFFNAKITSKNKALTIPTRQQKAVLDAMNSVYKSSPESFNRMVDTVTNAGIFESKEKAINTFMSLYVNNNKNRVN